MKRIEVEEVQCAVNQMKIGKASVPSAVALEMFKASGDKCLKSLTNTFNDILFTDKLLEEWIMSWLVPNPNSYRGIKLSSSFSVKVGVHPLLFIMIMDVLTEDVRDGSFMELLYPDDFVWGIIK